jgi:tryptophanase
MLEFKPVTLVEPFRIKSVEPVRLPGAEERRAAIIEARLNPFKLKAKDIFIDLLTDSGTTAMSSAQWGAMLVGDESYAGSTSFYKFEEVVRRITGFKHILPTHQGRAAERVLFTTAGKKGQIIPSNTHFDTTRANIEANGIEAVNLLIPEGHDPKSRYPFKGNLDVERLEALIKEVGSERIPVCMLTITNNAGGGQPVSMANIKAVSEVCHRYEIPLFIDACRFAENSWFIKQREPGYANKTPLEIAQEIFSYADGCTMSAKKDGLGNIGGFLALNNDELARECTNLLITTEGFPTYGGLAGYDLEALAVGFQEVLEESYLNYRIESTAAFGEKLLKAGIPIMEPPGGHAIYVDGRALLPHIPPQHYPAWALSAILYEVSGVRAGEVGQVILGRARPDGSEELAPTDLLRLALPRRVYTQNHLEYVVEAMSFVAEIAKSIKGLRITYQPLALRHFTAEFEWRN